MRAVVQRVKSAELSIDEKRFSKIGAGLVVFLGFAENDDFSKIKWLAKKVSGLRIFEDEKGKMNLSLSHIDGEVLIVPNFTLFGDCSNGYRPSFSKAMEPSMAKQGFDDFVKQMKLLLKAKVQTGVFGADMKISQINDGPITILIDI